MSWKWGVSLQLPTGTAVRGAYTRVWQTGDPSWYSREGRGSLHVHPVQQGAISVVPL